MLTPEEKKKRDKEICEEWVDWHDRDMAAIEPVSALQNRISVKYGISEDHIYKILRENTATLKHNVEWRKFLRISKLQRLQSQKKGTKKDLADLMEQERKELEGDKPLVDMSHKTMIWQIQELKDSDIRASRITSQSI